MHPQRRKFRLIRPELQLRLILSFLGISVLALLIEYLVFMRALTAVASELPHDGNLLMGEIPARLLWIFLFTAGLLLPTTLYVGVVVTRRIVGPIYRFETWLGQVLEGKTREECRLRKGDELMDLCALINRATLPLRNSAEDDTATAVSTPVNTTEDPRAAA